jgi:hypothetical protein
VLDNPWLGPGLLHITYTGYGNFAIWNYDAVGERIDLLVNVIGNYEGIVLLDFMKDEETKRFAVESEGDWTIEIRPIDMMRVENVPSTFTGTGDEVIRLRGGNPDLMKVDATGDSNFAIWILIQGDGRDLAVNEIAPYQGTVVISKDTFVLIIEAEGEWSIEIMSR